MKDPREVVRRPLITEKSTLEREGSNIVTFDVAPGANKIEIKAAVEALFDVKVLEVRTSRVRGKRRRVGRHVGRRADWKKARVVLRQGDAIEFFEGV
jgi:large subunit ribosomal protein L23